MTFNDSKNRFPFSAWWRIIRKERDNNKRIKDIFWKIIMIFRNSLILFFIWWYYTTQFTHCVDKTEVEFFLKFFWPWRANNDNIFQKFICLYFFFVWALLAKSVFKILKFRKTQKLQRNSFFIRLTIWKSRKKVHTMKLESWSLRIVIRLRGFGFFFEKNLFSLS